MNKNNFFFHITTAFRRVFVRKNFTKTHSTISTKHEKQALSIETGLSMQKISNWLINSRRRTLPKVLEMEGKLVNNFTISRKNKKVNTPKTESKCSSVVNETISLENYVYRESQRTTANTQQAMTTPSLYATRSS